MSPHGMLFVLDRSLTRPFTPNICVTADPLIQPRTLIHPSYDAPPIMSMNKITTCLWFDGQAEDAANFYVSIFKNSQIKHIQRYTSAGEEQHGRAPGSVMVVAFDLNGHPFVGLNGGPGFKFSAAVSFQIDCANQEEVDHYWDKLREGGDEARLQCGWLEDKFGVSWQVVPTILKELLSSPEREKADRAMKAMMGMKKLDIAELQKAFDG
ncbi:3-demethylubiquinone-9 3-methyltransferase-domain-containing protein [Podospora didyma]|uniref:3-demethylubiquinone-9 3-methyltransferase-domain-containing protein n=1 Tax=Podospora didyma TaxID=330526 RepID=A0AAE0KDE6_9PEZI|nr:3-demethylubiquinone-9 3-methyltransferase-domain-containing protein [Podospora didyma]